MHDAHGEESRLNKTRDGNQKMSDLDRTVQLSSKDISQAELRAVLTSMKDGSDAFASKVLIEYFHRRFHDNLPYDQAILFEFLDHVFGRIVGGATPDQAFGFKQRTDKE